MKSKKNPKKDMRKLSVILFQIGLIVILFLSWRAVEWTTVEKEEASQQTVQYENLDMEQAPVTVPPKTQPPPPPPPPPPAPEKIEVVEDEVEVEEKVIETPEEIDEPEVVNVQEVEEVSEPEPVANVPFAAIANKPIFPGCEKFDNAKRQEQCMNEKVQEFILKRFDTDLGNQLGLSGVTRILAQFVIDENGKITNIQVRAPHPRLKDEAKRVVNLLPQMTPGKQRGKPVKVTYALPIAFKIQD